MSGIVFGIGQNYKKYKEYINLEEIVCFVDNNPLIQGEIVDTKKIYSPDEVDYSRVDYVLVLAKAYKEIYLQLKDLGVPEGKLKNIKDMSSLFFIEPQVYGMYGKTLLKEWMLEGRGRKQIFLLSHNLGRSGVPVALMNLAIVLKELGYRVLLGGMESGGLEQELKDNEIDFINNVEFLKKGDILFERLRSFDVFVIGSWILSEIGTDLAELQKPVMWWLHESCEEYCVPYKLPNRSNIRYYAGGQRVADVFRSIYPEYGIDILNYYHPKTEMKEKNKKETFIFGFVGAHCKRKGQDILLSAIEEIPEEIRILIKVIMVTPGYTRDDNWLARAKNIPQVELYDELSQEELDHKFQDFDVLICPSRDDPMPIVVTQAFEKGIPSIISNQVGQASYFDGVDCGFVFESENVAQLAEKMIMCVKNKEKLKSMRKAAYKVYSKNFSKEVMIRKIEEVFKDL